MQLEPVEIADARDLLTASEVAIVRETLQYCAVSPFHPCEAYPEWPGQTTGPDDNPAYRGVRELFVALGLDAKRFDSPSWDPLGDMISPGDTVVLKPNFVNDFNLGVEGTADTDSLITHGSILRVVLDYVGKALQNSGRVLLCDCPIQSADWQSLLKISGWNEVAAYFRTKFPGTLLDVKDMRLATASTTCIGGKRVLTCRGKQQNSLADYVEVDLGADSLLVPLMDGKAQFGVSEYPRHRMQRAHSPSTNRYLFPKELLEADVVINLPKLKTHSKAGITCALKNLVGINGHKDYLPHFRFGDPLHGGDERPNGNAWWSLYWGLKHLVWERDRGWLKYGLNLVAYAVLQCFPLLARLPVAARRLGGGSWVGNDTVWRTLLDINRAFLYYDPARGVVDPSQPARRKYLVIVDGIVSGEGEGPLSPLPKPVGYLLASCNPLAVDTVAATLMGFDYSAIKQLMGGYNIARLKIAEFDPQDIRLLGDSSCYSFTEFCAVEHESFRASSGYRGFIERQREDLVAPSRARDFFKEL